METEVARVAAACDLRAFRYIPFAGIAFDPVPLLPAEDPVSAPAPPDAAPAPAGPAEAAPVVPLAIAHTLAEPVADAAVRDESVLNAAAINAPAIDPPAPPAAAAQPGPAHRPAAPRTPRPEPAADSPLAQPPRPAPGPDRVMDQHRYRMLQDLALDPPPQRDPPRHLHRSTPRPAMPALQSAYPPRPSSPGPAAGIAAPLDDLSQRFLAAAAPRAAGTSPRGLRPRRAWPR